MAHFFYYLGKASPQARRGLKVQYLQHHAVTAFLNCARGVQHR